MTFQETPCSRFLCRTVMSGSVRLLPCQDSIAHIIVRRKPLSVGTRSRRLRSRICSEEGRRTGDGDRDGFGGRRTGWVKTLDGGPRFARASEV